MTTEQKLREALAAPQDGKADDVPQAIAARICEIHQLLKRGEGTKDHGVIGNLDCIYDSLIQAPNIFDDPVSQPATQRGDGQFFRATPSAATDGFVRVPLLTPGETPQKVAAFDAWYATIKNELPHNEDGSHSGTYWVALMEGIKAYLAASPQSGKKEGWISVKERLPDEGEPCLFIPWINSYGKLKLSLTPGEMFSGFFRGDYFHRYGGQHATDTVCWWYPVPLHIDYMPPPLLHTEQSGGGGVSVNAFRCGCCQHWDYHYPDDMGVCTVEGGPGEGKGFAVPVKQAVLSGYMYSKYCNSGNKATSCDTYCDKFSVIPTTHTKSELTTVCPSCGNETLRVTVECTGWHFNHESEE